MPRNILRSAFLVLACLPLVSGHGFSSAPFATYTFGVSLNTGLNNQLYTLFTVKVFEGEVIHTHPLTREQFVLQAQGVVPSKANPLNINLFRNFEVGLCLPLGEDTVGRFLLDCEVFDRLWKLRFWEYPYKLREGQHPGKGWAETRTAPSPRQLLLLTDYGMLQLGNLAYGDNTFRLLRDVSDSAWVDNYRKGY